MLYVEFIFLCNRLFTNFAFQMHDDNDDDDELFNSSLCFCMRNMLCVAF